MHAAPAPFTRTDARDTTTPIAAIGTHPISNRTETLYFGSEPELVEFLRLQSGKWTVFDLDRKVGEWDARQDDCCKVCGTRLVWPIRLDTICLRKRSGEFAGFACTDECADKFDGRSI